MSSFADQVKEHIEKAQSDLRATLRTAVQDTISMAQQPVGDGGRMPIKTGFLRASIQAALWGAPAGPSSNPSRVDVTGTQQLAGEPVSVVLLRWDPSKGTPLVVGWTANYARNMEAKYGFLRNAVGQWDVTVRLAAAKVGLV